jgi:hypothetical protein
MKNIVSWVHRLLGTRIVDGAPWTGSHDGGATHQRMARQCSKAHKLAVAT